MRYLPLTTLALFVSLSACGLLLGAHSASSYIPNAVMSPFPTMPIPNYAAMNGATISIETGYAQGYDKLLFSYQGNFPITQSFDAVRGTLYLMGDATISEYADCIQSVQFVTSAQDGAARKISWSFGKNTLYNSLTQHYYAWGQLDQISWSRAVDQCAATTWQGMQGYLATVSSADEHNVLTQKLPINAWIGAQNTLPGTNNTWFWMTGPEMNQPFWTGGSMYNGGAATGGMGFDPLAFAAWDRFQPTITFTVPDATTPQFVAYVNKSQPAAMWQAMGNSPGPNGFLCEFGGMDSPAVAATYGWYGGSTMAYFNCTSFSSSFDCTSYASLGCAWNGAACQSKTCGAYDNEGACSGDWRCSWEVGGLIGICANTLCSRYTESTCQVDPRCTKLTTGTGSVVCVPARCSDIMAACDCARVPGCGWQTSTGTCINSATIGCDGVDLVLVVDGTSAMSGPFQQYSSGFQGLIDILRKTPFALTGTSSSIPATSTTFGMRVGVVQYGTTRPFASPASTVTGDAVELQNAFTAQLKNFAGATTTTLSAALTQANAMLTNAPIAVGTTARTKAIIIVSAQGISDAATIKATTGGILSQLQTGNVNVYGVALQSTSVTTGWLYNAWQSLSSVTPIVGVTTLGQFISNIVTLCNPNVPAWPGMIAKQPTLDIPCGYMTTPTSCSARAQCSWSFASNLCLDSSCQTNCPTACAATPTCKQTGVSSDQCANICPGLSSDACQNQQSQYCNYDVPTAACTPKPCVTNPTEDACIADPVYCVWNPNWAIRCQAAPCISLNTTAACTGAPSFAGRSCVWTAKSMCVLDVCSGYTAPQCATMPQCKWDPSRVACAASPCGGYADEFHCAQDQSCAWNVAVTPALCQTAPCAQYATNATCSADPTCGWALNPLTGDNRCTKQTCAMQMSSCQCATMPNSCVWQNNQCLDNRFVQCKAIDIMFLVEGTSAMNQDFGRHPDGFAGVVSALRGWARNAPFSATGAGFRAGLMLYGNGGQLSDPAFASSAATFSAQLDAAVLSQPTYAQNVPVGSCTIEKALSAAYSNAFNINSSPDRQRLIIVLGTSQLTDKGASFVQVVNSLASIQVSIFANLMQRFSTLTPQDQTAGTFLAPVASEPTSWFFSYTDIDKLRPTVLDGLCDPSTNVGQALQTSRDGVLPCTWLSGSTECNMQPSCNYAPSTVPVCPLPNQCPNLGCMALPSALAADFDCTQCTYKSGAFACSISTKNAAKRTGSCQNSPCQNSCSDTCTASTCLWSNSQAQCQTLLCPSTLSRVDCDAIAGCVYDETLGGCRLGTCTSFRSAATCGGLGSSNTQCNYITPDAPPAVCQESRCLPLMQATCTTLSQCDYSSTASKCYDKKCTYTSASACQLDSTCYWNPFTSTCALRGIDCVLSLFSPWSACTSGCGSAIRYKTRRIVQPANGGQTCGAAASIACNPNTDPNCQTGQSGFVVTEVCPGLPACTSYCGGFNANLMQCIGDNACQWSAGQCIPRTFTGCAMQTADTCNQADSCQWDSVRNFCFDAVLGCPMLYKTQALCGNASGGNNAQGCMWNDGSNAVALAQQKNIVEVSMVQPGQVPVFLFPNIVSTSNQTVSGASIVIESGYQLGKDTLTVAVPVPGITATWLATSGVLRLSGAGLTVSAYMAAIAGVTFQTFSLVNTPRIVTWSFGTNVLFSANTGHYYQLNQGAGTWSSADAACKTSTWGKTWGMAGYLATVQSPEENTIVSTKLGGEGWLGGDDIPRTAWQWSVGPAAGQRFWLGGANGIAPQGAYANWNAANGEPVSNDLPGSNRVYLNLSGYWSSKPDSWSASAGFVCEFGGTPGDIGAPTNTPVSGAMIIGIGGCLSKTMCSWHINQGNCSLDASCRWSARANLCVQSCATRSTIAQCTASGDECTWDTSVIPPICDINVCANLGEVACPLNARCSWNGAAGSCMYKTGCAAKSQASCQAASALCTWTTTANSSSCMNIACAQIQTQDACVQNSNCVFSNNQCINALCQASTKSLCIAPQCTWSDAAVPNANGAAVASAIVGFIPQSVPVAAFPSSMTAPANGNQWTTDGFTVAITSGVAKGQDTLSVQFTTTQQALWTATFWPSGVLVVTPAPGNTPTGLDAFNTMVQSVFFSTTSTSSNPRTLSYVLSANAIVTSGQNVIKSWPTVTVQTFSGAGSACATSWPFGTSYQGTLAYITNEMDDINLRALGAFGWFGASATSNNIWTWTQSSNAAGNSSFWTMTGAIGSPVSAGNNTFAFSHWAAGQPNNASIAQQYAYYQTSGTWKSIASGTQAPGVLCQYQASLGNPVVSGSSRLAVSGCYATPCLSLTQTACQVNPLCMWNVPPATSTTPASCIQESWCSVLLSPSACRTRQLCNWDYDNSVCARQPPSPCSASGSQTSCTTTSLQSLGCVWNTQLLSVSSQTLGACTLAGCAGYTLSSACNADPLCIYAQGTCMARNCGYLTSTACWSDNRCMWQTSPSASCKVSTCAQRTTQATCSSDSSASCGWDSTSNICYWSKCSSTVSSICLQDTDCLFANGKCSEPNCNDVLTEAACNADAKCFYFVDAELPKCRAAQCTSKTTQSDCVPSGPGRKVCKWNADTGSCGQSSTQDMYGSAANSCVQEVQPNLWWVWLCLGIILLLLIGIVYRLYLAHSKGMSFLDPSRNTSKFSPHAQYAADLFEEAKVTGVETNTGKPSLNDL